MVRSAAARALFRHRRRHNRGSIIGTEEVPTIIAHLIIGGVKLVEVRVDERFRVKQGSPTRTSRDVTTSGCLSPTLPTELGTWPTSARFAEGNGYAATHGPRRHYTDV